MMAWLKRLFLGIASVSFVSIGAAAQDFDAVLKQAVSDATSVYSDPRTLARVSALVALEFQLKSIALEQEFDPESPAYNLREIITANEPESLLWTEIYQPVYIQQVSEGQDVNWDDQLSAIENQLRSSYEKNFERHAAFVRDILTPTEFPDAVATQTIEAIDSAVLTTGLLYRVYRQRKLGGNDKNYAAFVDCIFWPFCF